MTYVKKKVNVKEILKVMKNHQKVEEHRKKVVYNNLMNKTLDGIGLDVKRNQKKREVQKSNQRNGKGFLH